MKQAPKQIGLIAVDMDGTLLDPRGKITPKTIQAIHAAQQAGIVFAICTGRFFANASILLKDAGLDCPVIALNGGQTARRPFGQIVASHPMDRAAALKAFRLLEAEQAWYYIFGEDLVATRYEEDRHHSLLHFGDRMVTEAGITYTYGRQACLDAIDQGLYKYYVHANGDARRLREIRHALRDLKGLQLTHSSEQNIEIMPPKVNKGQGIKDLAAHLGIPLSETMAIGDQDNDLPMILAAGWGVAMGNSTPEVLASADAVTGSNTEDGVAQAIERYALSASGQAR